MVGEQNLDRRVLEDHRTQAITESDQYQLLPRNDRICYADPTTLARETPQRHTYQPLEYSF